MKLIQMLKLFYINRFNFDFYRFLLFSLILFLSILTFSCSETDGNGVVVGKIFILGCNDNFNYGSPEAAYFDLQTNFVASDPILDETVPSDSNRLDIRLQNGSNPIDDSDSLYIQISNTAKVARYFTNRQPIPVGVNHHITASLSLYLTCPDYFDGPEATPDNDASACPTLTSEEYQTICDNVKFGSIEQYLQPIAPFQEGQSCLILCSFGKAKYDDVISDTFAINFKDTVSGIFFFTLKNRSIIYSNDEICNDNIDNNNNGQIDEDNCISISSGGFIQGNFKVKTVRAKSLIAFP